MGTSLATNTEERKNAMYRVKPSKPVAVFGALVGVGMLAFGTTADGNPPHLRGSTVSRTSR